MKTVLRISTLIVLAALAASQGYAQTTTTSTKGTDFWMTFLNNYIPDQDESLDLFIASSEATTGTVTIPGQMWSIDFTVEANQTTTITIPNAIGEMFTSELVEHKGIHITTADTVSVFAVNFNPYTADGTKILPTATLGTNYIVSSYVGLSPWDSEFAIVATEDDTEVEIIPSCATVGGHAAWVPMIVQLQQGEVFQVIAAAEQDLTGTIIRATEQSGSCRPFAVFSGTGCANVPAECGPCDHLYEQDLPIELWGREYYITPFVFEVDPFQGVDESNYTYRILAQEDNTTITIDGAPAGVLDAGEFLEIQYTPDAHCIIGSKNMAVIQYMESLSCGGYGDPSMIVLDDANKKIDNITFSTVESAVMSTHYLNVIIETEDIGSVTLDGVTIAPSLFQSFPNCTSHVWAGFEISAGSHTLDAPDGVTAYVYGNGFSESYAYSVGSFSANEVLSIDYSICTDSDVVLQMASNFFNPYWYNLSEPEEVLVEGYTLPVAAPITNTVFVGVGSDFVSGCEQSIYYSVESSLPPQITIEPGNEISICQYQVVALQTTVTPASPFYTYEWSNSGSLSSATIPNPIANPLSSTAYTLSVSTLSGCASNSEVITIEVGNGNVSKMEADVTITQLCPGESTLLSVETEKKVWSDDINPGIAWGDWDQITNGSESTLCGSVSGNALYFNGSGMRSAVTPAINCSAGGTVYFSLKIANGIAPCDNAEPGDNVLLEYSINGAPFQGIETFFESAFPDFVSLAIPIPSAAQSPATKFRWRQVGVYMNNQDNWVLDEAYIGVVSTADFNYTWSPSEGLISATSAHPTASPNEATTYVVSMTDALSGCVYTDSVNVEVEALLPLTVTNDTTLCDIQGIALSAAVEGNSEGVGYQWHPTATIDFPNSASPVATPLQSTVYYVEVLSPFGCVQTDSVRVSVGQLMGLSATASASAICLGETVELNSHAQGNLDGVEVLWAPVDGVANATQFSTTSQPNATTEYSVTLTHTPSGCTLTQTVPVQVSEPFSISLPEDVFLCTVSGEVLTAETNYDGDLDWHWLPEAAVDSPHTPSTMLVVNETTDLLVTATNEGGCEATASMRVVRLGEITDLGSDFTLCGKETAILNTGWPSSYSILWNTGSTSSSIEVSSEGIYTVSVTSPLGCSSEDEVLVTQLDYPQLDLGPLRELCEGESVQLFAGVNEYVYTWAHGVNGAYAVVSETGYYEVTAANGDCETTAGVDVLVHPMPQQPFARDTVVCFSEPPYSLVLNAQNAGFSYQWMNGSTAQTLMLTEPNYVTLIVTSEEECSARFEMIIHEECAGAVWIPNAFTPNGDGLNDAWLIQGENIAEVDIQVWNKWGELIFRSNDLRRPWLGQRLDGDEYKRNDLYQYVVIVRMDKGNGELSEPIVYEGTVTMVR